MFIVILNLFVYEKNNFVASVAAVLSNLIKPLKTRLNSLSHSISTVIKVTFCYNTPSYYVELLTSFMEAERKEKYLCKG